MYTIGVIIYGSPTGDKARAWFKEIGIDDEKAGLETDYSGNADHVPSYVGVTLGKIDETTDAIKIDCDKHLMFSGGTIDNAQPFSIEPTAEQIDEAQFRFYVLPQGLQKLMPPLGVYIVWKTS